MNNEITIIDGQDRTQLGEGRNNGMAFGFCKKNSDTEFETIQAPSPCKDFLNEVVFTERYDVPSQAHGLKCEKRLGIFDDGKAYLAMTLLEKMEADMDGYDDEPAYEMNSSCDINEDFKLLEDNHKNIEKLLNELEELIGIEIKTIITKTNGEFYLLEFSKDWCKSSIAISLYSLLVRIGMYSDGTMNALDYLRSSFQNGMDGGTIRTIFPKIELIIERKELPPTRASYSKERLGQGYDCPHNEGIMSWDITHPNAFEEVQLND